MIVGHNKQLELLKKTAEAGKLPHAYLFCGQSQIGKKKVAIELVKFLFCESDKKPCGICRNCIDVERNSHPDFLIVGSENNKEIQMAGVRDMIWKLALKPYSAPYKVAVIDNASQMNREAQNAFLKTLEEPSGNTLLIMITEFGDMMLPTISSRSQKVKFFPIKNEAIASYLESQGSKKEEAEKIANLSFGRPGRAIELFNDKEKIQKEEKVITDLKKMKGADVAFKFKYAKQLSDELAENDNFKIKDVFDAWLNYFRSVLFDRIKEGSQKTGFSDLPINKIKNTISSIQTTNYLMATTNINNRLALEVLLLEL